MVFWHCLLKSMKSLVREIYIPFAKPVGLLQHHIYSKRDTFRTKFVVTANCVNSDLLTWLADVRGKSLRRFEIQVYESGSSYHKGIRSV